MCVTFYMSKDGWRWRIKGHNGRIVANSGESFANLWNAKRAFFNLYRLFTTTPVNIEVDHG